MAERTPQAALDVAESTLREVHTTLAARSLDTELQDLNEKVDVALDALYTTVKA